MKHAYPLPPWIIAVAALPALAAPAVPAFAQAASSAATEAAANPASVLLDQAQYWHAHDQPARARQALERVFTIDPRNAEALAMQAQMQIDQGERSAALATIARLRAAHPDDPRLSTLERSLATGPIDQAALADARRLAGEGHTAQAVHQYQQAFHGSTPPDNLAVEYYQVLSGTESGWQTANEGLARLIQRNPQDISAQLAYATLLTYRDQTRAEGIRRLTALAKQPSSAARAAQAWKQALQWLPDNASSIPAFQAWLDAHPDDTAIAARLKEARNPTLSPADQAGQLRSKGFDALNAGKLKDAEAAFQEELSRDPHDAEALGGLGLTRLRQGDTTEARDLLSRAIAADPAHAARWQPALAGASVGQDYATARSLIEHGQLEAAERQLRSLIARGGDTSGAQAMLASVEARRGNLPAAEASYRAVLSRQPNNADALIGLADVLTRQGRTQEAEALLNRAEGSGNARVVGRLQAQILRQRADTATDPATKLALLRAAVNAAPNDPWLRLDLARALSAAGQKLEARQTMAALTQTPHPSNEALQAAAIFAAEDHRPADAAALVARLPPSARTAQMQSLQASARLDADIRAALAQAALNPAAARRRLLALAAQPDPDGTRGAAIARAFLRMGDSFGVREALATAQAATPNPTPAQRIAYAGVLLQAGRPADAQALLDAVGDSTGLTAEQQTALDQLRAGIAIRTADKLNEAGRTADAYDQLAPALRQDPDNPQLNMALGRLYQSADRPQQALAIDEAVLRRDPVDLDARRAAVGAAIRAGDWQRAAQWARQGTEMAPDDPRAWLAAADLARARGNNDQALRDLRTARNLRSQQLAGNGAVVVPAAVGRCAGCDVAPEVSANPFRDSGGEKPADPAPPADPMLAEINRDLTVVNDQVAPKLMVGAGLRGRSGTAGLDQLMEATVPLEATFSPGGRGQLRVMATPTFLSAGQLSGGADSQRQFGTAALGGAPAPESQHAEGVGLDVAYNYRWFNADVGSTPLGFQQQNIVGGVELSPALSDHWRLRLTGERRAVTDSLLSYAGTTDPRTGIGWGGVTRARGHAQLEFTAGPANFYVGGGYDVLDGQNVAQNTEAEFGAGGSFRVWHSATDEVRAGLDLVYFGYDKNLRFFSLGQGGYFSPQSYFAALIPVEYRETDGDLSWSIGGSVGYQTYTEHSSPVFPNNPDLQNALVASAATTPGVITQYSGSTSSGLAGGAHGQVTYRVNPALQIGGSASYQRAGNWNEARGTIFARYIFNGTNP